jgi:hypothetical protein
LRAFDANSCRDVVCAPEKECAIAVSHDCGTAMTHSDSGDLMNYLVRMVVPMRREFGRQLDVRHFLHDHAYAREVIEQALTSRDARLLQYAHFVQQRHLEPQDSDDAGPAAPPEAVASQLGETVELSPSASPSPAELREQVLRKYTGGQR